MDESAFVEWLLNPELQISPQQSPRRPVATPSRESQSSSVSTSSMVPSIKPIMTSTSPLKEKIKSPVHDPMFKEDSVQETTVPRLGTEDEDVFHHLLTSQEFHDPLQTGDESHYEDPAELLEPLALSKRVNGSFKDTFLNLGESPVTSPNSRRLIMSIASLPTSPEVSDSYRMRRHSTVGDDIMAVLPLNNNYKGAHRNSLLSYIGQGTTSTGMNSTSNSSSVNAIQALQQALWSNSPAGVTRLNPDSVKHVMMAATNSNGLSRSVSTGQKPYGLNIMSNWIPTSNVMLTPTSIAPPELNRNISNKKSKARTPTSNCVPRMVMTTAAATLAASLSSIKDEVMSGDDESMMLLPHELDLDSLPKPTKGKKCIEIGCIRRAQSNSRCKAHGGGARCQYTGPGGCTRSSQGGGFCRAHGGGKRCEYPGCTRGQQRKGRCYVHGGIRKCQNEGCEKKDRGNGYCISHGGGKRCIHPGCTRAVRRGTVCQQHEEETIVSMMMS